MPTSKYKISIAQSARLEVGGARIISMLQISGHSKADIER